MRSGLACPCPPAFPPGRPAALALGKPCAATLRSPAPQVQAAANPRDAVRRAAAVGDRAGAEAAAIAVWPGGMGEKGVCISYPHRHAQSTVHASTM